MHRSFVHLNKLAHSISQNTMLMPVTAINFNLFKLFYYQMNAKSFAVLRLSSHYPLRCGQERTCLSKEHQKSVTEAHCNLATTSLKSRAQIIKFQGNVLKTSKDSILLVRLTSAQTSAFLPAAQRILSEARFYTKTRF
jgi:hypothetical protein